MRLIYLDNIKALGISLVILYHCSYSPCNSLFVMSAYSMCVPLFFMVNGYLMLQKEHTIEHVISKNIKIIIILYFWALLATAETMWAIDEWSDGFIEGIKILLREASHVSMKYCGHLWFLKSIFFLNILNPILYFFIHNNKKGMYILLVILFLCTTRFFDIIISKFYNPLYGWDWYPVLYYILGYALLAGHFHTEKIKTWHLGAVVMVLLLMQWGYNWIFLEGPFSQMNISHEWIPTKNFIWFGYWSPIIVFATTGVCLLFQKIRWKKNRFWNYVGRNSLAIYLMQSSIISILSHTSVYRDVTSFYYPLRIVLPILTLLICMGLTWLLQTNKYTRYLISI